MTNYEKVFEEAIGNYGLITSAQAVGIGVSNKELVKLASRGRLTRIGQGTYKLVQYAPAPNGVDAYADSVAIVGEADTSVGIRFPTVAMGIEIRHCE